jgi:hypothetical protein
MHPDYMHPDYMHRATSHFGQRSGLDLDFPK